MSSNSDSQNQSHSYGDASSSSSLSSSSNNTISLVEKEQNSTSSTKVSIMNFQIPNPCTSDIKDGQLFLDHFLYPEGFKLPITSDCIPLPNALTVHAQGLTQSYNIPIGQLEFRLVEVKSKRNGGKTNTIRLRENSVSSSYKNMSNPTT